LNYYFHVPFCRSRCGYCAFYSRPAPARREMDAYLDELERRLAAEAPLVRPDTVYVGGGTPTYLPLPLLERLFSMIRRALRPSRRCEITVEANPETLDAEKVALLCSFATRISLGVQSFDAGLRRRLGRECSDAALARALELVRGARFPHWNCDLIYAVPGETPAMWRRDLELAAATGADHLSCYALTPEEGARLAGGFAVDDDAAADGWRSAGKSLGEFGFRRYEVSNYARRGAECRHNLAVWRGGLLRGFGPSASGFDGAVRRTEPPSLAGWLRRETPAADVIAPPARLAEIFAINLRTASGWTPSRWRRVPGADPWEARLAAAESAAAVTKRSFWRLSAERIALTGRGLLFWDSVAEALLA